MNLTLADAGSIWLQLALLGVILALIGMDAVSEARRHKGAIGYLAAICLAGLLGASFVWPPRGIAFFGAFEASDWSLFLVRALLLIGVVVCLGSAARVARVTPYRQAEYFILLLFSLVGAVTLAGAKDLVLLVICFELASIPLYVLAAYEKSDAIGAGPARAAEGTFKLFTVGVVSTPLSLFGMALVVGLSGSTQLAVISRTPASPLFGLGVLFILAGMGFKLGVVPFHMWMPDAYQAAPTPFVAFMATAPKIAALTALTRLFLGGFGEHRYLWVPAVIALSVLSLLFGNLWALGQRSTRRLLAYSGIGHIGYLLLAFVAGESLGLTMMLFYLVVYVMTNMGAFLVVEAVSASQEDTGGTDTIDDFAGLARRSPWLALAMLVFLLSLGGIPFVAGFWAKLYVFLAVWKAGYGWLVVLGALLAVVALFYYLQIARAMYMTPPDDTRRVTTTRGLRGAILICLVAVLGIGVAPAPLLAQAQSAASSLLVEVGSSGHH